MIRKYHNHTLSIVRKSQTTITGHQEYKKAKQPGYQLSLPIKVIATLEWTQSNAQQIIEQLQNPTMGVKINNETTTTTEPPP